MPAGEGLPSAPAPDFEWRPFDPAIAAEFREVLQATYIGSLDMPELEGRRAGSTTSWPATRPPGCSCPSTGGSGASPASPRPRPCCSWPRPRAATPGRSSTSGSPPPPAVAGWDCAVIRYALELARGHVPILELAVDLRNTPAVQLYRATGFTPRDRRAVHLAVLG